MEVSTKSFWESGPKCLGRVSGCSLILKHIFHLFLCFPFSLIQYTGKLMQGFASPTTKQLLDNIWSTRRKLGTWGEAVQEQQWLHSACSHRKETEALLTGCQTCRLSTRKSIYYKATFAIPKAFNIHVAKRVHARGGYEKGSPRKSKLSSDYKKLLQ